VRRLHQKIRRVKIRTTEWAKTSAGVISRGLYSPHVGERKQKEQLTTTAVPNFRMAWCSGVDNAGRAPQGTPAARK
jgi:hypothetical protein